MGHNYIDHKGRGEHTLGRFLGRHRFFKCTLLELGAPVLLHTCAVHADSAIHATCMQHACNMHAANRHHACNMHATCMQHACNTHATCAAPYLHERADALALELAGRARLLADLQILGLCLRTTLGLYSDSDSQVPVFVCVFLLCFCVSKPRVGP